MSLKADYRYCEKVIKQHSASFYKAFSKLPKPKRNAVYAVYAFCRLADDAVDVYADAAALNEIEAALRAFEVGDMPDSPVYRALDDVFKRYEMAISPFYHMIEGQRMDLQFRRFEQVSELERYCYHVAGTVGLMLLPIVATENHNDLKEAAIQLGEAMQITNILRDVGEDLDRGRLYLPTEWLIRFGVDEASLNEKKVTGGFVNLWEHAAGSAETSYETHLKLLALYDADAQRAMRRSILFYREILNAVRRNQYDCLTKRAVVPNLRKLQLLLTGL